MIFSTISVKEGLVFRACKIFGKSESVNDQVISQLKNANGLALSMLYNRFIQRLFNYGMHTCQNKVVVVSCLEELFRKFNRNRGPLSDLKSANLYFFKTFRRLLNERLDGKQRFSSFPYDRACQFTISSAFEEAAKHGQIKSPQHEQPGQALSLLTCMQREAILLRFFNELNYRDVSDIMDLPVDAVYDHISKAIEVLSVNQKESRR